MSRDPDGNQIDQIDGAEVQPGDLFRPSFFSGDEQGRQIVIATDAIDDGEERFRRAVDNVGNTSSAGRFSEGDDNRKIQPFKCSSGETSKARAKLVVLWR